MKKSKCNVKIEDKTTYRGHYYLDGKTGDWYTSQCLDRTMDHGYSRGYEFTHGSNVLTHLYGKLKAGLKLSCYEKMDFHDKIPPRNPVAMLRGEKTCFHDVLIKLPVLNFWILEKKMDVDEKEEFDMTYDSSANLEEAIALLG